MPTITVASTDEVDELDRVAYWEDYNARQLVALRCTTYHDTGLRAHETNIDLGGLRLADIRGNSHVIDRSREHVSGAPKGSMFLSHLVTGRAFFVHAGGCLQLAAGDTVLYSAARPYLFGFETTMRQILLDIPEQHLVDLDLSRAGFEDGLAIKVTGGRQRALTQRLAHVVAGSNDAAAEQDASSAADLLAAAIAVLAPEQAHGAALTHAAETEIRRRLTDPALDADAVARAVGVSSRHLNRLFARQGTTVTQRVQDERLQAAHRDLVDPACNGVRIADIAARWGFSSHAHLARVFRRELGSSPSEIREKARESR